MREQRAKLSRNNDTTKAINYCLSRWDAFSRFLDDGRLCMSNNAAERELRAVAVGRKIGPSPAPMRAAGVRLPSTASSPPPSSMTSTRRLGPPTCWRAYRITLPSASTNSCPGIGDLRTSLTPHERGQPSAQDDLTRGRHRTRTWQAAMEALILVAEGGGPTRFARIGIMRALNRHHVPKELNPKGKEPHWGRRKLKRDQ